MLSSKTPTLLAPFLLLSLLSHAQETTKVQTSEIKKGFTISKTYQALKANTEILHGAYRAKVSSYEEKGYYNRGQKSGIWDCLAKGKLVQQYDFDNRKFLVPGGTGLIEKITLLDDSGTELKEIPVQPVYLGGDDKLLTIFVRAVRYPGDAMENNIQGYVRLSAILGKDGKLREEKTISKLGHGLEEETLRVFKLMPQDWIPVYQDGKPVDTKIIVHFKFTLS